MGTTSNYSLPYPGEGDLPDGAAQVQALAEAVDTALAGVVSDLTEALTQNDSGWVNLTVNGANSGAWTADGECKIRKIGKLVIVRFAVQRAGDTSLGASDTDGSSPFTLASTYRPSGSAIIGTCYSGFFSGPRTGAAMDVDTTGAVNLYAVGADITVGKVIGGTACWFVS